ncbi:hypothetical protein [Marinitenerispora sediminis]|nr:hypothetical protein [Marinitenerispora sediminis]
METGDGREVTAWPATAVEVRGAERDRLYAAQAERVPLFAHYQGAPPG